MPLKVDIVKGNIGEEKGMVVAGEYEFVIEFMRNGEEGKGGKIKSNLDFNHTFWFDMVSNQSGKCNYNPNFGFI